MLMNSINYRGQTSLVMGHALSLLILVPFADQCAAETTTIRGCYCDIYVERLGSLLLKLQRAEGDEAAQCCRAIGDLYREWLARRLEVNYMLTELDPEGKTQVSRSLWTPLVAMRRPEALQYLVSHIDDEHIEFSADLLLVPPFYKFEHEVAVYGAAAAGSIDRYIATESTPLSPTKLHLFRSRYEYLYSGSDKQSRVSTIVEARLRRHLGKPWVSDHFPRNLEAILKQFDAPRVRLDMPLRSKYREFVPLDYHNARTIEDFCGSIERIGRADYCRKKIVENGIMLLPKAQRQFPDSGNARQLCVLRLLHDVYSPEIVEYLIARIDFKEPNHPALEFRDAKGAVVEYPFIVMAAQYGELCVEPIIKALEEAAVEAVPEQVIENWAELLRQIYGNKADDVALAEMMLKLHVTQEEMVPANIQRCIRALHR